MTSLAIQPQRASRYSAKSYAAFRVTDVGANEPKWRTYPVAFQGSPQSIDEALQAFLATRTQVVCHKDRLVIRETDDETGAVLLHVYAIKKKSRPDYVYRDYATHREHRLYAEPVCVVDAAVLNA